MCSYGDDVASMAWGARNLISTQARETATRALHSDDGRVACPAEGCQASLSLETLAALLPFARGVLFGRVNPTPSTRPVTARVTG